MSSTVAYMTQPAKRGPGRRSDIDWEAIEHDYRTGKYTENALCKKHAIARQSLHNHINSGGWKKDLTEKVKEATRAATVEAQAQIHARRMGEELARKMVMREKSTIELAAAENVLVIREHKGIAQNMRELSTRLFAELSALSAAPNDLANLAELVADRHGAQAARALMAATSLPARIGAARDLATTARILIDIERKAHGLDDGPPPVPDDTGALDPDEIAEIRRLQRQFEGC